ncbi:MAG: gas vesicle protein GvpJ [Kofleriaceae bacterium]
MLTTGARGPRPSSLVEILDKGMVIDAFVRVSLVGIELLTIDARIVIASVDTYLRFAEAVNRLDLYPEGQPRALPKVLEELKEGGAEAKTRGALTGVKHAATDLYKSVRGRGGNRGEG